MEEILERDLGRASAVSIGPESRRPEGTASNRPRAGQNYQTWMAVTRGGPERPSMT